MNKKASSMEDVFSLFRPEALTEEQFGFYQNTAAVRTGKQFEFNDLLLKNILSTEKYGNYSHLLVVGHRGCGKSTELNMLDYKLREAGSPVVFIKAIPDLDLYGFEFIDVLMLIIDKLAQYADSNNLKINKHILDAFRAALSNHITLEYWDESAGIGLDVEISISSGPMSWFLKAMAKINSYLKVTSGMKEELRREIKSKMPDVIRVLNAFVKDLSSQTTQGIVIIIDGLEKCIPETVRKLFVEDLSAITGINAHLIISCPPEIYLSVDNVVLTSYFSSIEFVPMIKTHDQLYKPYRKGIKVIKELVFKRADASFFGKGVLEEIILGAGGSLRETCRFVSNCAFEAMTQGKEVIDAGVARAEMNTRAIELFRILPRECYAEVKKIYEGDTSIGQRDNINQLLYYGGFVFEYNHERWVDLHPLLRKHIEKRPEVLD